MSKGRTFASELLALTYNATAIADLAENDTSSPLANIFTALHTAWPSETAAQNASECAYTGYGRHSSARTSGGWTVTNDTVAPAANMDFGQRTDAGAAEVAAFFSTGVASSGATKILHRGVIGSRLGPFTAATSDTFTVPGLSGLANGDRVTFLTTHGSSLPTGITEGALYFVISLSGDTFQVSLTSGGAAVDVTGVGDGVAFKVSPITINQNSIPRLLAASTVIYEE